MINISGISQSKYITKKQNKSVNYQNRNNCLCTDTFCFNGRNITMKSKENKKSFLSGIRNISFKGWSPGTKEAKASIEEIVDIIKNPKNERIAISGHVSPDGDCIGSSFALANMIQQTTGKKVDLFVFGDLSKKYDFLNKDGNINVINIYTNKDYKAEKLKENFGKYDIAIAVDVALKRLLPDNYLDGIFSEAGTTIRIDHHPYMKTMDKDLGYEVDNNFADYNYSDTDCNSAAQVIMQFTEAFGISPKELTQATNDAMYTGIVTDTGNFQYTENEKTFLDAALLLQNGVNNMDVQSKLTGDTPLCIHKIRQHMYDNIKFTPDGKIAYFIENDELAELKAEAKNQGYKDEAQNEIANIIESLIKIQGVEIAMKILGTNFSVRSKEADISQLAMKYGGGGHKNASAFCVKKAKSTPAEEVIEKIIQEYQEELKSQN